MLPGACPSRSARDRQASKSGQGWLNRRRQPYCFFRSGQWAVSSLEIGLSAALSAKSPAGGWVEGCPWKTFSQVFATMPGPLFRRPHGSVRVLMRTRETLFAATASGSSSATSSCVMDVALGFYHKEVMSGVVHLCPALRVDSRWVSNWHTERKSSRTQQSEI